MIRLAEAADFDALAAITNHYIRTTAIHFGCQDVTADELRTTWREHVDVYPWLVTAGSDRAPLGYAKAGVWRTRAAYRWTTETGIYLDPAVCGQGLGRIVYGRLLAMLRYQGFHAAIGGIALPNAASVRLHERLGFVAAGTFPQAGRKFERWHDVGFWRLPLQPDDRAPTALRTPADAFAATATAATP